MTVEEVARVFNAKRIGRGKYMALCPSHPDRNRSLSIKEGKRGVMLRCWSQNCDVKDIVKAAGLPSIEVLFYDSGRKLSPTIRRRSALRDRKASLEHRLGLVVMLRAIDEERYWARAESRIRAELFAIRMELEPEVIEQEILKRLGKA